MSLLPLLCPSSSSSLSSSSHPPAVGEGRLELVEVAPGVDIARDVLAHMDFEPVVRHVELMDPRIFQA